MVVGRTLLSAAVATAVVGAVFEAPSAGASQAPTGTVLELAAAPISQSRAGVQDLTPGVATFVPVRPGAPVAIQRKLSNGRWQDEVTGKQDSKGEFSFAVDAADGKKAYTFRAETVSGRGALIISGEARSANWGSAWAEEFTGTDDVGAFANRANGHAGSSTCSMVDPSMTHRTGTALQLRV
ncbi:MAG TPA: hypothetical protein VE081_05370, partial [Sporichthyaceae bacterium]|nr:hypothetical protein [Sporichthyaceae bacterium]